VRVKNVFSGGQNVVWAKKFQVLVMMEFEEEERKYGKFIL
jgi:hypothetical protein